MKALLINPESSEAKVVDITNWKQILKHLECQVFDVCTRQIGTDPDRIYDIYVDDMGLFKSHPKVSAWGADDHSTLVGTILVSLTDSHGDMKSLTQNDIDYILSNFHYIVDPDHMITVHALFPVYYPTYN